MIEGKDVVAPKGAVAVDPPEAARVGARILESGGNAMDAAVAASMACCMLQPHSTGIGGYVLNGLVLEGGRGRTWCVDANAVAPAAAHERMYEILPLQHAKDNVNEWEYDCSVRDHVNVWGPLSVAVPGMTAGMGTVWERWGRLKWADIVAPSQKLLSDGFPYALTAGAIARCEAEIRRFPETARHLMPEGRVPKPDDIWHRLDMEKTLGRLAAAGWRDFYDGEIGRTIADHIARTGGILTRADMAAYKPRIVEPYSVRFRGADVFGSILPNGGLSALQALNMFEALGLPPEDTPEYWHLFAEIMKLVWRDRLRYLADPDFADVPVERLLGKEYAAGRVEPIRQFPRHVDRLTPEEEKMPGGCTLHVSAADAEGNVAALTISQGMSFGSLVTVPGTGIILGHGMCRLDPRPGRANSVASGKRPLNNTCPMMVRMPGRDIGIGLPGGRIIVGAMARAVQLLVERGATSHAAATAPRLHVETREPLRLTENAAATVFEGLRRFGHEVESAKALAGCMNGAEFLKASANVRAGSGISAAGI